MASRKRRLRLSYIIGEMSSGFLCIVCSRNQTSTTMREHAAAGDCSVGISPRSLTGPEGPRDTERSIAACAVRSYCQSDNSCHRSVRPEREWICGWAEEAVSGLVFSRQTRRLAILPWEMGRTTLAWSVIPPPLPHAGGPWEGQ